MACVVVAAWLHKCLLTCRTGCSTRSNLYRPYVYTSIGVAAAAAIFVSIKGALYDYSIEPSWMARPCDPRPAATAAADSCGRRLRRRRSCLR